eukprot:796093-Pyramimonas_sp.AAC.1
MTCRGMFLLHRLLPTVLALVALATALVAGDCTRGTSLWELLIGMASGSGDPAADTAPAQPACALTPGYIEKL